MSAIENNNTLVNCTVERNYVHEEIRNTRNKRRKENFNASKIKQKTIQKSGVYDKRQKCDGLWITPFGNTEGSSRNKACREKNCTAKWIKLEGHLSKSSKGVTRSHHKKIEISCAISSKNINESQNCSVSRTNQAKCQNNYEKHLSRQSGNTRKIKGHVIPTKPLSIAITPFLSSQNVVFTCYVLFALLINFIFAIDSRTQQPTVIINNHIPSEVFSSNVYNKRGPYDSSLNLSQFGKHELPRDSMKFNNHVKSKNLPYFNNNSSKVFQKCHKCSGATNSSTVRQENHFKTKHQTEFVTEDKLESSKLRNALKISFDTRRKRETEINNRQLEMHQSMPVDEENDAKLWRDMMLSMRQWQQRKQHIKSKIKNVHHRVRRDEEIVCYADVGCFHDDGPFNYLDMLPSPPEEVNTQIFLYTRRNRNNPDIIPYNSIKNISGIIQLTKFNISAPLKVIIHGFGSSCQRVWPSEMRLALLTVEDVNVICVDWSDGAADPNYVRAAVNTRLVGKQLAILIESINRHFKTNINGNTHFIGFSLGAHVAGFAGDHLKNLSRITGLDPAGPLFEGYEPSVRLDKSDAAYVDVIHSNGESLIVGGFGTWEPIGHVDFYPNGGRAQRGCQHLIIGGLYDFIYSYSSPNETSRYLCNHRRAYRLFTDSISPKCSSTAFPCESYEKFERGECFSCSISNGGLTIGPGGQLLTQSCGKMGYHSDKASGRGSQYLLTRDGEPFCGKQFKIIVTFSGSSIHNIRQTYGRLQITLIDKTGLNETFLLTSGVDDLLSSGTQLEKLIVAHPAIDPVSVHLLYVAYEGWIYTGRARWKIDKLLIVNEYGGKLSACRAPPLTSVISSTPSTPPTKLKLSTTTSSTKILSDFESIPSISSNANDFSSKGTTDNSQSHSSPPPSILPASITSLSAPAPPSPDDKLSAKSSEVPKPTPKIEVEGKLLPILRSGIPQSIQLVTKDCDIPSLAEYYAHFSGTTFYKKSPYLHNNLYNLGNGVYQNGIIHGNQKYSPYYHPQVLGGKESINSLIVNQPPPPPPPPTTNFDIEETTLSSNNLKIHGDQPKMSEDILGNKITKNESSVAVISENPPKINDALAPISIPTIKTYHDKNSDQIIVSTKLKPPPRHPNSSPIKSLDVIEVSDSVAPDSIPALGLYKKQEKDKTLYYPTITTTYYNVVNNGNKEYSRPSFASRPRPKIHIDDLDPSMAHKWNQLGKYSTHHQTQNGYLNYHLNGKDNPKWPYKSTHSSFVSNTNIKRPHPNWPQSHQQLNRHPQYQNYKPSHGTLTHSSYYPYNVYHQTLMNTHTQSPYQITHQYPKGGKFENDFHSNEPGNTNIEFIKQNNPTDQKVVKHTIGESSNTEATLMGKDSAMQRVTMHHLSSDEQLTILKVNPKEKDSSTKDNSLTDEMISSQNYSLSIVPSNIAKNIVAANTNKVNKTINVSSVLDNINKVNDTIPENHVVENNFTLTNEMEKSQEEKKVDYIVLHKLPNGEALDLENMKTYTMLDLESELDDKNKDIDKVVDSVDYKNHNISSSNQKNQSEPIRPLTHLSPPPRRSDMPRSIDFSIPDRTRQKKKQTYTTNSMPESTKETNLKRNSGQILDFRELKENDDVSLVEVKKTNGTNSDEGQYEEEVIQSYMSETPEDIEKLKSLMMNSEISKHEDGSHELTENEEALSPMYIITEEDYMKHKSILQQQKNKDESKHLENDKILHFSDKRVDQHQSIKINTEETKDIEFLPTPKKQTLVVNIGQGNNNNSRNYGNAETEPILGLTKNNDVANETDLIMERLDSNLEYHWTPMPQEDTTPSTEHRVFGPQLPPEGYVPPEEKNKFSLSNETPIEIEEIGELSKIAYITLTDDKEELTVNIRKNQKNLEHSKLQDQNFKQKNETSKQGNKGVNDQDTISGLMNVQLLPPRLSAVLTHVSHHLPHRPSIPNNPPKSSNVGALSSKERSIGQYNPNLHNVASYGHYANGLFRQNKIAPIFKEDEKQPYQAIHKSPPVISSHDIPFGHLSDIYSHGKPSFPLKQPLHSLPKSPRAIAPPLSSLEPRSYIINHGRQNNARRINYPTVSSNQPVYHASPYQTQIVPGVRDPHRYIPLHESKPPSKKHVSQHYPPLRWRSRHRGFHGRKNQQKHRRPLNKFNAKMLQASPTYASVEISRSHRRKVHQNVKPIIKEPKVSFPTIELDEAVKLQKTIQKVIKDSEPFVERKLLGNNNDKNNSDDQNENEEDFKESNITPMMTSEIKKLSNSEKDDAVNMTFLHDGKIKQKIDTN